MKTIYLQGQTKTFGVEHIDFPTGEKHIRVTHLDNHDRVTLVCNSSADDLMKIGMAVDICRRADVKHITLVMPFTPYARQDRVAAEGDPFSIKVFANFLNSLNIDKVVITDPHSDVTSALINNVVVVKQYVYASKALLQLEERIKGNIAIVAPDIGAAKKAKELQTHLGKTGEGLYPIIQCDKTRCPKTGEIKGFKILDGDPKGYHCLMVDDICDGGGTFLGLADVLGWASADGQSLFVTHGIYSRGTSTLLQKFNHLFTTDSLSSEAVGVTKIPLGGQSYV